MMKKNCSVLLIFIILSLFRIYSQEKNRNLDKVIENYNNYFKLEPETFYTQINKQKFFNGESLWFKSYIYNTKTLSPYFASKNIHISIYDSKGNLVENKIFYAENATTFGHFEINKKYKPGKYLIKTSSNWMKNFNENRSHLQEFEVLGNSESNSIKVTNNSKRYDFQILPEGGHIINNTVNVFGFKIVNNQGKGCKISNGEVYENNNLITTFKNNRLGIGKFKCFLSDDKIYTVKAILENGETLSEKIESPEKLGVAISAENIFNDNYLIVQLKTNKSTLPNLIGKTYYIAIHRDGFFQKIDMNFEAEKLNYAVKFKKEIMIPGVNILTLFNENAEPISERILFNPNGIKTKSLPNTYSSKKQKDSTTITYTLKKGFIGSKGSLSISVLPKLNKSYRKNTSIKTAFLLNPYVKGKIEEPDFYFNDLNRKTLYNIDLLLITQGWSRYSWDNIFYKPQYPLHDFEIGFNIKGKINNHKYNSKDKIILISKSNGIQLESALFKDCSFEFKNLFIADSSDIQFSLKKNRQTRPNTFFVLTPKKEQNLLSVNLKTDPEKLNSIKVNKPNQDIIYENPVFLDTILLENSLKPKKPKNILLQGSFGSKYFSFDDNKRYSPGTFVTDVIKDNGFDVQNTGLNVTIKSRRIISTSTGPPTPAIFIDNQQQIDFRFLASLRINEIEEMTISNRGNLIGAAGVGGVIQIFTKTNHSNKQNSKFNLHISKNGFSKQKEYYSPNYDKSKNDTFEKYGAIHWIHLTNPDINGNLVFKIPNYILGDINLYIEGMAEDGSLISETKTIFFD